MKRCAVVFFVVASSFSSVAAFADGIKYRCDFWEQGLNIQSKKYATTILNGNVEDDGQLIVTPAGDAFAFAFTPIQDKPGQKYFSIVLEGKGIRGQFHEANSAIVISGTDRVILNVPREPDRVVVDSAICDRF